MFAKATWKFGEGSKFHPLFSLAAGGGRIRHVVSFSKQPPRCGAMGDQVCIDTIGAGPVLFGPGGGLMYDLTDSISAVAQVNTVLAVPDFTFHLDANLGLAIGF
jgi:hypothetical protein